MRLDRRFTIVLGLSLVWALLVSAGFYRMASHADKQPQRPQSEHPVVVAVTPMGIGAVIKASSVKVVQIPESVAPKGGFSRIEDVLDRPVISSIQADEPIVEARIAARGSGGGLAPLIPSGMRAISVRVNDVVGVAGFILPGMRVDVLVTGSPPGLGSTMTTTVLQNIVVLSVGQTIQVDAKSQAINAPVVTLLVTPPQAEALTLANNEGKIQLILRNSGDQQVTPTIGRELGEIYGQVRRPVTVLEPPRPRPAAPPPAAAPPVAPRAPEPPPDEVLIIRGNQKNMEPVPGGSR